MMNNALHTIASVNAICKAISTVPALWWRNAARMGWICMMAPSVRPQVPGRLHVGSTPGRVERGDYRGDDRDRQRQRHQRQVHMRQPRDLRLEQQAYSR